MPRQLPAARGGRSSGEIDRRVMRLEARLHKALDGVTIYVTHAEGETGHRRPALYPHAHRQLSIPAASMSAVSPIGRAIIRDPEVFLFDEPLSNLRNRQCGDCAEVRMRLEIAASQGGAGLDGVTSSDLQHPRQTSDQTEADDPRRPHDEESLTSSTRGIVEVKKSQYKFGLPVLRGKNHIPGRRPTPMELYHDLAIRPTPIVARIHRHLSAGHELSFDAWKRGRDTGSRSPSRSSVRHLVTIHAFHERQDPHSVSHRGRRRAYLRPSGYDWGSRNRSACDGPGRRTSSPALSITIGRAVRQLSGSSIEPLGAETLLHFDTPASRCTVRVNDAVPAGSFMEGDTLGLVVDRTRIHVFPP